MKKFLNTLEESMCLLDSHKNLMYLNESARMHLGYDVPQVGEEQLSFRVEEEGERTRLYIANGSGKVCAGVVETTPIQLEGVACLLGKIEWSEGISAKQKAALIEDFLENLNRSICIKDANGMYIYANKHYRDRIEIPKEKVYGTRDDDYWDEQYAALFKESDDYTLETNMECVIEEKVAEEEKYFETTKFPFVNEGERYIGIIIKDISIQKILYKQLTTKQSEEDSLVQFEEMIRRLKDYFKTDRVNLWRYNEERESITPCFNMERIKNELGRLELPLLREEAKVLVENKEAVVKTNHLVFHGKEHEVDETKKVYYVVYYPLVYENKLVALLNIVLYDAPKKFVLKNYFMYSLCQHIAIILGTQNLCNQLQKENEQRINVEDDFARLINMVTDLIVRVDKEGYFKKVNEGCRTILGWEKEEMLHMQWQDIIHPDDYEKAAEALCEWEHGIKPRNGTYRYRGRDGEYRWLRWDGCYEEKEGTYITAAKDITYAIMLESKEKMAQEVLQIEKVRNEFFANLSHEFKTPLTMIMSALQMLEGESPDSIEKARKYIGTIRQNSYRLLKLVNNLIDTTRIDSGYYDLKMRNDNIVYVVEEIVLSVAAYAKDQAIEIVFDTDVEELVIACDADKIERIMLNLLSNAIKYTVDVGCVEVRMHVEEDAVVIGVQDTGVGIPEEKVPFIFERFIQVNDVLTRHCEGSGIGLYLVKSLVELHGGSIGVSSKQGEGTRFEVRLPRTQLPVVENTEEVQDYYQSDQRRIEKCHIEFADIYKI